MPLTTEGWTEWSKDDILQIMTDGIHQSWEDDVDLSENSPTGKFIRGITDIANELDMAIKGALDNSFLDSAEGTDLDRLGANVGVSRKQATPAIVTLSITGTAGYLVPEGSPFSTDSGLNFYTAQDCQLDKSGQGSVIAYSEDADPSYNVAPNTVVEVGLGVEEVDSVTNPVEATGGTFDEDDETYRQRISLMNQSGITPTHNGILNAIYSVDGVVHATRIVNNTDSKDADGNPPHTLHYYVQGGKAQAVGEAIAHSIADGKQTVGQQAVKVEDVNGNYDTYYFDYAGSVKVSINIKVTIDPNNYDHDTVLETIKDSISNYFDTLKMGDTVILTKLYGMVYDASDGIKSAQITLTAHDGKITTTGDVQVPSKSVATFDPADLTVGETDE